MSESNQVPHGRVWRGSPCSLALRLRGRPFEKLWIFEERQRLMTIELQGAGNFSNSLYLCVRRPGLKMSALRMVKAVHFRKRTSETHSGPGLKTSTHAVNSRSAVFSSVHSALNQRGRRLLQVFFSASLHKGTCVTFS